MKRWLLGIFTLLAVLVGAPGQELEAEAAPGPGAEGTYKGKVVVIEAGEKEMGDLRKFQHWEAILKRAEAEQARAVVFRIDSSGGYVDQTLEVMGQIADLRIPTFSFVAEKAHGAGALLAVSTDAIYAKPEALIGGGGFVNDADGDSQLQRQSILLAKLRVVAQKQGRPQEIVEALLLPAAEDRTFGSVKVAKGNVLTLTGLEAGSEYQSGTILAKGVVESLDELLEKEGLGEVEQVIGQAGTATKSEPVPFADRQGLKRDDGEKQSDLVGKTKEESFQGQIVVVKIGESDLMNKQSFKFWRRMLRRAEDEGAAAVVFDIDTPGGYAFKTKEMMTEITRLKVPSFAFVNEDALSAGALVSVATDAIYMNPDSLIGAAGLVSGTGAAIEETMRDKLHSVFEAHVRTVAEKKGYDPELIRAMMIADEMKDRVFGEVVVKKGELLTLTANEAASLRDGKPLLAKGIVTSVEELAAREGLEGVPIVRATPTPFEQFAWWVAKYSFILILIGMGAAYAEMKAPGFGVGGAISLTAFGIFFFGNYVAGNLPGYEWVALFVLGIILVLVELFLIPGTGVTGIAGAFCIVISLTFGMVDRIDWGDWRVGEFDGSFMEILRGPILSLSAGLLGGSILIILLMRFLPDVPLFRFLMVERNLAGGASLPATADADHEERIGWTGETLTDLRPAGKAQFGADAFDVVTDGSFIPKGATVRIVDEDGMRVVVTKCEAL